MRSIPHHLYLILALGCKTMGRDAAGIMGFIEEDLTPHEFETLSAFVNWSITNDKPFGHGNYNERFAEWREATGQPNHPPLAPIRVAAEGVAVLREIRDEITRVNKLCGSTVFNPALTEGLDALLEDR